MNNSKNALLEYFQKKALPLPKYTSIRIGGRDHDPLWQSTVLINNTVIVSDICSTKRAAEFSVSDKALVALHQCSIVPKHIVPPRTVLLVDVENLPCFIDETLEQVEGLTIYAFIGQHHHLATKVFPPEVIKILSPSTRRDGTDTCIQVHVGILLANDNESYDHYLIATRDHFGSALVDMITSQEPSLLWDTNTTRTAKVVTQVSHIYN